MQYRDIDEFIILMVILFMFYLTSLMIEIYHVPRLILILKSDNLSGTQVFKKVFGINCKMCNGVVQSIYHQDVRVFTCFIFFYDICIPFYSVKSIVYFQLLKGQT